MENQNNAGKGIAIVGGLGLLSFLVTKLFFSGKPSHQWELEEEQSETVSHPTDIGVELLIYQGINESEGKWNAEWKRRDGARGNVYADTKKQVISKALKEAST